MDKKGHALLITYYWPPAGGAGVHRWLRFSKYFKENGWDLTVYCPSDAVWSVRDEGLQEQVAPELTIIKRQIFEPNKYLGKAGKPGVGLSHDKDPGVLKKMLVWVRGNLFIPDARAFWIRPSVKFLEGYLKKHPEISTIISTGPPHSMHVIALQLKRKLGIRWVADFRDPWTQIDFYNQLSIGERADKKQRTLEKQCLTEADEVVTVSENCAIGLEAIVNRKVHVITNGFEFEEFDPREVLIDSKFIIAHFGSMPESRNPTILWDLLCELIANRESLMDQLEVHLYGNVDYKVVREIEKRNLSKVVHLKGHLSHQKSIEIQRKTPVLLLIANSTGNTKGILTGKLFEYIGARRPIIALGEENSDLEKVIKTAGSGYFVNMDDKVRLKEVIYNYYKLFQSKDLYCVSEGLDSYQSDNLTKKIVKLL